MHRAARRMLMTRRDIGGYGAGRSPGASMGVGGYDGASIVDQAMADVATPRTPQAILQSVLDPQVQNLGQSIGMGMTTGGEGQFTPQQLRSLINMAEQQAATFEKNAADSWHPAETRAHYANQAKAARDAIIQYKSQLNTPNQAIVRRILGGGYNDPGAGTGPGATLDSQGGGYDDGDIDWDKLRLAAMVRGSTFDDSTTASGQNAATTPGIATPGREGLGQMYRVTDPTTGRSTVLPKIDVGPAAWTGRGVDISPGGASALGLPTTAAGFPTDRKFDVTPASQFGFKTNYAHGALPGAGTMTSFPFGKQTVTVSPEAAPYFQGFLGELQKSGAPIGDVGSFNQRTIQHSPRWSQHAYGNAIDIGSQSGRNQISPELTQWIQQNQPAWRNALNQYGMVSGGDWTNPDLGHVEWGGMAGGGITPQTASNSATAGISGVPSTANPQTAGLLGSLLGAQSGGANPMAMAGNLMNQQVQAPKLAPPQPVRPNINPQALQQQQALLQGILNPRFS